MVNYTFKLSEMSEMSFSVTRLTLCADSEMNQNESHIHSECEIYINLSGDVAFEVENSIYPVARGTVIITRPHEYHHCIYRSNEPHDHFWITFSASEYEDHLAVFFGREKGENNSILLSEPRLQQLIKLLDMLMRDETSSLKRRIATLQMFDLLQDGTDGSQTVKEFPMLSDVARALEYMDKHLTDEIDIRRLAAYCSVSINSLERHFKQSLKITPSAMLRKKRLIASLEELRRGSSVTEAAIKSGFSDYSNYIQLFKRQFGRTPNDYKKQLADNIYIAEKI